MTALTIAIIAVVVSAFATVTNRLAGMIAAQPITTAVTVSAAVIGTAVTTTCTAAMATAVSTTTTTTTTTTLRIGGVHDREVSWE